MEQLPWTPEELVWRLPSCMSFWMLAEPQAAEENGRRTGRPPRLSVEAMQWDFLDDVTLQENFQRKFKVALFR